MGIKDQFQDKANEIRDRAEKAGQGVKDEMAERTAKARQKKDTGSSSRSKPQSQSHDGIKDELDDRT
ncbi:hypothetical protein ACFY7H_18750 [Streptomyces sp. NPDC012794]|uniref:hypothetical protein n=1 Tax=Streptomyces sp. NPDC012794 TaxID=3364850 RepID=UPI003684C08A